MSTEWRGRMIQPAATMGHLKTRTHQAQRTILCLDSLHRAACHNLRMLNYLFDAPDAGARRAGVVEAPLPALGISARQRLLDDRAQRRLVLLALEPVAEARILECIR